MTFSLSRRAFGLILMSGILLYACKSTEPTSEPAEGPRIQPKEEKAAKRTVWDDMETVTEAYYTRSYDVIQPFLQGNGQHPSAVAHAWRALTHVSLSKGQLQEAYSLARQVNTPEAWMALSFQDWKSAGMLELLQSDWLRYPEMRTGLSVIMGRQGNADNYNFMISVMDSVAGSDAEAEAALALSRLQARNEMPADHEIWLERRVFEAGTSPMLNARYLYGAYRSDASLPEPLTTDLIKGWRNWGYDESTLVDQYMVAITGGLLPSDFLEHFINSSALQSDVQLDIELARWLAEFGRPDPLYDQVMDILLTHDNPHVKAEGIRAARIQTEEGETLSEPVRANIMQIIAKGENADAMVWLTAVEAFNHLPKWMPDGWYQNVEKVGRAHPYYTDKWLQIVLDARGAETYLETIRQIAKEDSRLRLLQSMTHLGQVVGTEREWSDEQQLMIREITMQALETADRGVLYALQPLLLDDRFVLFSDAQRILKVMDQLSLPGDIEAYQALARVLYQRPAFRKAAQSKIEALAAQQYQPLNSSLREIGWDIPMADEPKDTQPQFRRIDWNRLERLGEHPVLVLRTEKGSISVRLNTFASPATVSALDALAREDAYNGIPFHRVVRNFVIQGGDIERQDGFGGPDFVIPTEPDVRSFTRGAIGIASAGPDTEGSQYFIMHQWKPHLDGRYTRFGEVIDGLEVVDRIEMGDVVKTAEVRGER